MNQDQNNREYSLLTVLAASLFSELTEENQRAIIDQIEALLSAE